MNNLIKIKDFLIKRFNHYSAFQNLCYLLKIDDSFCSGDWKINIAELIRTGEREIPNFETALYNALIKLLPNWQEEINDLFKDCNIEIHLCLYYSENDREMGKQLHQELEKYPVKIFDINLVLPGGNAKRIFFQKSWSKNYILIIVSDSLLKNCIDMDNIINPDDFNLYNLIIQNSKLLEKIIIVLLPDLNLKIVNHKAFWEQKLKNIKNITIETNEIKKIEQIYNSIEAIIEFIHKSICIDFQELSKPESSKLIKLLGTKKNTSLLPEIKNVWE